MINGRTGLHGFVWRSLHAFNTQSLASFIACVWLCSSKSNQTTSSQKTFIARGNSYAAKEGETDDLVMALVLIIRMVQEVVNYEEAAYEYVMDDGDDDDLIDPMPFSML